MSGHTPPTEPEEAHRLLIVDADMPRFPARMRSNHPRKESG
jgi:hypothetical protein